MRPHYRGTQSVKGIVLAGGKSSRFGSDKALALYQGVPLVQRAVFLLRAAGLHPAVITRTGKFASFLDCPVIEDKLPNLGPLGGLYTAMTTFQHETFLALTCDMPLLNFGTVYRLMCQKSTGEEIVIFEVEGRDQPFPGVYPRTILPAVRRHLMEERYSLKNLTEDIPVTRIPWIGSPEPFLNVNRTEDLPQVFIS